MDNILMSLCESFEVDSFIFVGTDPHQLEDPQKQFKIRHALSNFYGSAGSFVVLLNKNTIHKALWTDGRYEIEAEEVVDSNTQVYINKENDWQSQISWIITKYKEQAKIVEPKKAIKIRIALIHTLISTDNMNQILHEIKEAQAQHNVILEPLGVNYLDFMDSLGQCSEKIFSMLNTNSNIYTIFLLDALQTQICNRKISEDNLRKSRISQFISWMRSENVRTYISASPHELAWLLYVRSINDSFLMVFPCFFIFDVTQKNITIFLPENFQLNEKDKNILEKETELKIEILNYDYALKNSDMLRSNLHNQHTVFDPHLLPYSHYNPKYKEIESPITEWKSYSSNSDLEDFKHIQAIDHIALIEAMAEINELIHKGKKITENEAAEIVYDYRAKNSLFIKESFQSISASASHAALPHYKSSEEQNYIDPLAPFLFDSGGHYYLGTTDLTRVYYFHTQALDSLFKEDFTMVLKSHIALAQFTKKVLPNKENIPLGKELDAYARARLLDSGRDFNHGIGHGVGYCTDVHEGVQRIGPSSNQKIFPRMIVSNEPGYYRPTKWGIRIENLVSAQIDDSNNYYLETLTFFPIQMSLVNPDLLDESEYDWLLSYHSSCKEQLLGHISNRAKDYLNYLCDSKT